MRRRFASGTPAQAALRESGSEVAPIETPRTPWEWLRAHPVVALLLAASLLVLLTHSWEYRFLTDDAFISFRYARNLAHGDGLVFNPGHERVEGYSNLLWVLILAALGRLGVPIESGANVLSLAATVALWALIVRETLRRPPETGRAWLVLVPAFALALTRSVAVWSTSGLETRLFEVLIVAAVFRLLREAEALVRGERPTPWAGVLLGLAEWTRPDGLLLAIGAYGAVAGWLLVRRRLDLGRLALWIAPCVLLIAAHLAFRRLYYGEVLPNTYYAKVDGRFWWESGGRYLEAFALEYGLYLWIPLIAAGVALLVSEGNALLPLVIACVLLPHALYVAAIGGDHFEYRPLDLVFPFAFLLLYHGARRLARAAVGGRAMGIYLAIVAVGLWEIPYQSHRQMPHDYVSGFPGGAQSTAFGREFLSPERDPIFRLPGLRSIAELHRRLLVRSTYHYSGIRQEEHRLFLTSMRPCGQALRQLIEARRVPRDLHIAMPCVGVIPYDADVRTLDRNGLTDAHVAHSPFVHKLRLAHDKTATDDYMRSRNVDLVVEVRPICDVTSEDFLDPLRRSLENHESFVAAALEPGKYLIGRPPAGRGRLARRIPLLEFQPMSDPGFFERYVGEAIAAYRERLSREPGDDVARGQLALLLGNRGRYGEALALLEDALTRTPDDGGLWMRVGWCQAGLGRPREAEAAITRSIALGRGSGDLEAIRRAEALLAVVRRTGEPPRTFDTAAIVSSK
jgi:hypothetical protein